MLFNEKSLNQVLIHGRGKDGQMGNFSLETLCRTGMQKEIYFWFLDEVNNIIGLESFEHPEMINRKQVVTMLNMLDRMGVQVIKK